MSVTAFRVFLRSPYHYYLTRVLKLQDLAAPALELDPRGFGNLIHNALQLFGMAVPAIRDSDNPDLIAAFLDGAIDRAATNLAAGGMLPLPAQVAQAKARLAVFAGHQAERRREGWQIVHTEWKPKTQVSLTSDNGQPMSITGRIDRIDLHSEHGYALIDYKTGSANETPAASHFSDDRWRDLQLPLYRILASEVVGTKPPWLGYVQLAPDSAKTGFAQLQLSQAQLDSADAAARDVIRRVQAGDFFDLGPEPPSEGVVAAIIRGLAALSEAEEEAPE
jgi:RecB family exonuclease